MELREIIDRIDAVSIPKEATITQLKHEEDNGFYQVWRIDTPDGKYILKETKGNEHVLYPAVFSAAPRMIPALHQVMTIEDKTYLLTEYVAGENLCCCNRTNLKLAMDALIALQQATWELDCLGAFFDESLLQRQNRGMYLNDSLLEEAYEKFLEVYQATPKALCHDDLLPFNIVTSEKQAFLIDWEYGGMLPYPTSFARLIAHAEDNPDALFYMTQEDKCFAVDYYYENLLKEKGISYTDWQNTLEYFLFYEYCEWVFVGNKYHATDGEYYKKYLPMAKRQAAKILKKSDL